MAKICARTQAMKMAPKMKKSAILLVNLSGRGDKDMEQASRMMNLV